MRNYQEEDRPKHVHKPLRDKLRKRRKEKKMIQKKKNQSKKQYQASKTDKKLKYIQYKKKKRQEYKTIPLDKLHSILRKFLLLYQEQIQTFYHIFQTIDGGGLIDIQNLEDNKIKICIKKIFKYLGLVKTDEGYKKNENDKQILSLVKNLMEEVMQEYMDASDTYEFIQLKESDQENIQKKKKKKHETQQKIKQQQQQIKKECLDQPFTGPVLKADQKKQLQEMFQEKGDQINLKRDLIETIFKKEKKSNNFFRNNKQEIPQHLLAKGSAYYETEMSKDQIKKYMEKYNKLYRNKSLLQEHLQKREKEMESQKSKRKKRDVEIHQNQIKQFLARGGFIDLKNKFGSNN